ncbi:MAG TPA: O-antigen ligase family protein [Methylomirabilota bacterium]|nr:O-antigen ligase family protein [Methylomirabilota bacterium]
MEALAAAAFVALVLCCVGLAPANGLLLLFLLPPLANGEDQRPYFFLLEIAISLTLLAGLAWHLGRRGPLRFPHAPLVVLVVLSALISLPLDLKEAWLEIEVSSWRQILEGVRRSLPESSLFWVRTVLNVASGAALYVLVVNERWTPERVRRLAVAGTLLYVAVTVAGLATYWFPLAPERHVLTVWLGGEFAGGFSGLGFNPSYFAQYAIAYLPLAGLLLTEPGPRWVRGLALTALLLSVYALLVVYQRAAYLVFLLELALLLLVALHLDPRWSTRLSTRLAATVVAVSIGMATLLGFTPVGHRALEKILWTGGDYVRLHLLEVAGRMVRDYPLLGVGSGRFARFFDLYSAYPQLRFGSWSAHNLYAQFLAEQGALGLASFLGLVAVSLGPIVTRSRALGAARPAVLFLLVSLGVWLVYGWLQYTFLLRSMQVYFWITLGLVVSLALPAVRPPRLPRRWLAVGAAALLVALGFRVHTVAARPVPVGYEWGFHGWEYAPEVFEARARWTSGGAVASLRVEGRALHLDFACPSPQVSGRPQEVSVLLDGLPAGRVVLDSPTAWKALDLPVTKPLGSGVILQIRVGYSFVPAELGDAPDPRRLGVLVSPPHWKGL